MTTPKKPTNNLVYIALAVGLVLIFVLIFFGGKVTKEPVVVKESTIIEQPAVIETDR